MIIKPEPGIYLIFCLANQRAYIGQSVNVKKRIANHQGSLKRGSHYNEYLQKAYDKYGVDMFVFRPLEYPEDTSVENLTAREQYWIDQFDSLNPRRGFNMMGAGPAGRPSEESKKKMSEAGKGRTPTNKGTPLTDEQKEKLSKAMTGRKLSEEHKKKVSPLGRKHSEETKRKIGDAHKGMKRPEETGRKISEKKKGKTWTEETRRNIMAAREKAKQLRENNDAI